MDFQAVVALAATLMEGAGVFAMLFGTLVAMAIATQRGLRRPDIVDGFRRSLGRAILLGLEFLVAADIIRTVSEVPTLRNAAILAVIVLIRTFLSFTLEVELTGRWPWRKSSECKHYPSKAAQDDTISS